MMVGVRHSLTGKHIERNAEDMTPYRCRIFSTIEKPDLDTRQLRAANAYRRTSGPLGLGEVEDVDRTLAPLVPRVVRDDLENSFHGSLEGFL